MNGTRALALISRAAALVIATVLLASCSPTDPAPLSTNVPGATLEHIHELVPDPSDGTLLVATHEGLYRLTIDSDGSATSVGPIGGLEFDPMGITIAAGVAYASGHPGPTSPDNFGTPNLGLISSTDLESWTNVSLTGVTDFHSLTVMINGNQPVSIFGVDPSNPRIQRSLDDGATWSDGAEVTARDILAVGDRLYATTPDGLAVSNDNAITFTVDETAPALFLLAADQGGTIAGVDTTGTLWTKTLGQDWAHGRTVERTPQALAVQGARIYIADDRGIAFTEDIGASWTLLTVHR